MIYAIDNQMREAFLAAGKRAVDLKIHIHSLTFEQHIKRYCLASFRHPDRCLTMRWGGLYILIDDSVDEGLALLQFVRKARSTRPEDV